MNQPYYYLPKWLGGILSIAVFCIVFSSIFGWLPEKHWLVSSAYLMMAVTMFDMAIAARYRNE